MLQIEKSVAFSGHRTGKLPKTRDKYKILEKRLKEEIEKSIAKGYDTFIMGACYGFDLLAAEMILNRQQTVSIGNGGKIYLIAAVPFEGQADDFSQTDQDLYYKVLDQCDEVVTLNPDYRRGCFAERNRWMVDRASHLICYFDGKPSGTGHTVKYAKKNGLSIVNLYKDVEG
ncbi:MAG: DUF1273 domain-containing protein [Deltaproteobacteria bacterium]|jgi:uncharacterized phage-like protein YoqJ|nr:DUF1273 domain-containing protein [Deltaproteobacteria bacterium]